MRRTCWWLSWFLFLWPDLSWKEKDRIDHKPNAGTIISISRIHRIWFVIHSNWSGPGGMLALFLIPLAILPLISLIRAPSSERASSYLVLVWEIPSPFDLSLFPQPPTHCHGSDFSFRHFCCLVSKLLLFCEVYPWFCPNSALFCSLLGCWSLQVW